MICKPKDPRHEDGEGREIAGKEGIGMAKKRLLSRYPAIEEEEGEEATESS